MARKKKAQTEYMNMFICCEKEFAQDALVIHLKGEHGVDTSIPATRRMTQHIDGADFFGSSQVVSLVIVCR